MQTVSPIWARDRRSSDLNIRPVSGASDSGVADRGVALACFTALLAMNVVVPSLKFASIPARGLFAVALLLFLVARYSETAARVYRRHFPVLILAASLAALGIFVSAMNGAPLDVVVKLLTEVHLQVAVTLLVAAILADICGARAAVFAIVAVVGVSGAVAILQALGLNSAWDVQSSLANMQREAAVVLDVRRPMGLSSSPIHLATQACLAFAAFLAVRDAFRQPRAGRPVADPAAPVALVALIAVCAASGTRSPIFGGLVFFGIYAVRRQANWLPMLFLLAGALIYMAWPVIIAALETSFPRITRVDDRSVMGRGTLAYFGLRLFLDNPLGYGFAFKPFDHFTRFWSDLYLLASPTAAQSKELHNYVLNMLNTYGIGLLLLAPLVARLLRRSTAVLIFFVPYFLHILFHNSGPFWNDTIVWFAIAAISAASAQPTARPRANRRGRVVATPRVPD